MSNLVTIVFLTLILFTPIYLFYRAELKEDDPSQKKHPKYMMGYIGFLPVSCIPPIVFTFFEYGREIGILHTISIIFAIMVIIIVYYPVVYFFLKRLRMHFRARSVALLWALPNTIYLAFSYHNFEYTSVTFYFSRKEIAILVGIWLAGFLGTLGYYIIEHFQFKHEIQKNSEQVLDEQILEVLRNVEDEIGYLYRSLKILYDPQLNTPLSFSNCIVLPSLEYTKEELYLIFKHELIHLSRGDPDFKFYIAFCRAFCWFNPFVWKCLRISEEDMELSCDETVIKGLDERIRKQYASLILSTAGDERGFTTCLSASGEALKYRMLNILHDSKKKIGYPVIMISIALILFCSSVLSIGIESKSLNDSLWGNVEYNAWAFNSDYESYNDSNQIQKVIDYLNSLKMYRVESIDTGDDYSFKICGRKEENYYNLYIYDQAIVVSGDHHDQFIMEYYYVKNEIDLQYIQNLLYESK